MSNDLSTTRDPRRAWRVLGYGGLVAGTVVAFLFIRRYGETLRAPAALERSPATGVTAGPDVLLHVLLAMAAVIITGQILAKAFRYLGQPPVIGEVIAGIVLGPSLLGPSLSSRILPASVAPSLGLIAQLGVILYMFLVGLQLNAAPIRHRARAIVATSHASILTPFILGAILAIALYPRLSTSDVSFTSFSLFLGVAMSITAFPVLARILSDHGMTRTELGAIALSCAATDDVTAWCLLALVVGVTQADVPRGLLVIGLTVAYVALMFLVVAPLARRFAARWNAEHLPRDATALVCVALLLSSLATEAIGVHAIFGAFLLGAVIPHDSGVARSFSRQLEQIVTVMLLPAFFAFTGMRTRIDLVSGGQAWAICGVIILTAIAGKFSGTLLAGRFTGMRWRDAAVLGTLMNTRGLMELIVLNIGLDLHIISPTLFSMMVIMALATTMMTAPILRLLKPDVVSETPSNAVRELELAAP